MPPPISIASFLVFLPMLALLTDELFREHFNTFSREARFEIMPHLTPELLEKLRQKYYPNQHVAQKEILEHFMRDMRYVLLRADVQSGKTGVYHLLIDVMFSLGLIKQAYIICGSNETVLLNQCKKDIVAYHKGKDYMDKIHVIFRQDFSKNTMVMKETLIVADETHLVQDVNQTLHHFLKKHGVSMAGTTQKMKDDSIYILSVDATPFAEESAMIYGNSLPKARVILENGDGYYGPQNYYADRRVHEVFDLSLSHNQESFKSLIERQVKKYILIRTGKKNKQFNHIMSCIKSCNVPILHYTSEFEKSTVQIAITKDEATEHFEKYGTRIPSLEQEPERTTVVLVDGRLRCGKRVCKNFIGFVWESSPNANTDTIIQGLFGRMCGYDLSDNKPDIYIPERIIKMPIKKVINMCELERYLDKRQDDNKVIIAPRFGTNILPGTVQNQAKQDDKIVTQCVPIRLQLPQQMLNQSDAIVKEACIALLTQNDCQKIRANKLLTSNQCDEIVEKLQSSHIARDAHIRHYQDESNQNMHKCHVEAYDNNMTSKEGISDAHFITLCVTYWNFQPLPDVQKCIGQVFVIFYTDALGYDYVINKESRVSRHNGISHFSIQASDEFDQCPAAALYGFSPKIRESSTDFQKEFDHFILFGKKDIGMVGKRFESIHNGEAILLPRSVYGNQLETFKQIIRALETKHSITITYKQKLKKPVVATLANPSPVDHQIEWIEWK